MNDKKDNRNNNKIDNNDNSSMSKMRKCSLKIVCSWIRSEGLRHEAR